jgi:hypothetical protein
LEMSPKAVVKQYVRDHYGNLISVGEPQFDPIDQRWVAELQSDYPRIIHNDRTPEERKLRFLTLHQLGTVKISQNLSQSSISATPREECADNLTSQIELWEERANRIIIKASSDNLAQTNPAQTFLGKIGTIIERLECKNIIYDREIETFNKDESAKLKKYLSLLEGLEIVEHKENYYSYGNMYTELSYRAQKVNLDLNTIILSHILKNRYPALRETFGITHLQPVIHIDSMYYRPALEADELISWKYESFEHHCNMLYGYDSKISFRLPFILKELVNVDALRYKDKMYVGNESLWEDMRRSFDHSEEFALPRA